MPSQVLHLSNPVVTKAGYTSAAYAGGITGGGDLASSDGDGSYVELWDHEPITLGEPDHVVVTYNLEPLVIPDDFANLEYQVRYVAKRGTSSPSVQFEDGFTLLPITTQGYNTHYWPPFEGDPTVPTPLWAGTFGLNIDEFRAGVKTARFEGSGRGTNSGYPENYGRITYWEIEFRWDNPAVTHAPPLRQYPRTDALGTSSARRLYPPPRSTQRSNRRAGGYL